MQPSKTGSNNKVNKFMQNKHKERNIKVYKDTNGDDYKRVAHLKVLIYI